LYTLQVLDIKAWESTKRLERSGSLLNILLEFEIFLSSEPPFVALFLQGLRPEVIRATGETEGRADGTHPALRALIVQNRCNTPQNNFHKFDKPINF
jgi:hypothetical protein